VSCGEEGTVWADERTGADYDRTSVEEGAVTVDVDTFAESMPMSLV
jgi:rhodanese-related sulfurtransferase